MDARAMLNAQKACTEEHAPECQATCPIHFEVRDFTRLLRQGNFDEAALLYRKKVLFPRLAGNFCPAPCEKKCRCGVVGEALAIQKLEAAAAKYSKLPPLTITPFMQLSAKVAVVGGGISGLTCALYLYEKGFRVTIFEKNSFLGGKGFALSQEAATADFAFLNDIPWQVNLGITVGQDLSLEDLCRDYSGVYVSGFQSGLDINESTFQTSNQQIFQAGSSLRPDAPYSIIDSIATGRRAAVSLDRFLKKVSLTASRGQETPYQTQLFTDLTGAVSGKRIESADSETYTKEEAVAEASRCLDCRCLLCVKQCKYLEHFEKYPSTYIREISNNISMLVGQRQGGPLINSCSLCGLCTELCPNAIQMPEVCKSARELMVQKGLMAPPVHDFPVRDMIFSNSDEFSFYRHAPGTENSRYLFFPGCQLAAAMPESIPPTYRYLQENLPDNVGLMLGCCGAPADWAGRRELFQETMDALQEKWHAMGKPTVIAACSTCIQQFRENIPEMQVTSLWRCFVRYGLPKVERKPQKVTIHDTCTARYDTEIQDDVRFLLQAAGYEIEEMTYSRQKTKCCGYGGLMFYGNRQLTAEALAARVAESSLDFLVYCGVCRDYFVRGGKATYHLLDIIWGQDSRERSQKPGFNISQKRENRTRLRDTLLKEFWQESSVGKEKTTNISLILSPEVKALLEDRLILEGEVRAVIQQAETTGRWLKRPSDSHFIAHSRPSIITYWVEYLPVQDMTHTQDPNDINKEKTYIVYNAYSHRLQLVDD